MSEEKLGFVGKQVKDIYGTYIGRAAGIITENDGEIEAGGVDCGLCYHRPCISLCCNHGLMSMSSIYDAPSTVIVIMTEIGMAAVVLNGWNSSFI